MGKDQKIVSDVLLQIPFMRFGLITVSLPAFSLAYCFLSAYLMDREGINDTDCNVSRVDLCLSDCDLLLVYTHISTVANFNT